MPGHVGGGILSKGQLAVAVATHIRTDAFAIPCALRLIHMFPPPRRLSSTAPSAPSAASVSRGGTDMFTSIFSSIERLESRSGSASRGVAATTSAVFEPCIGMPAERQEVEPKPIPGAPRRCKNPECCGDGKFEVNNVNGTESCLECGLVQNRQSLPSMEAEWRNFADDGKEDKSRVSVVKEGDAKLTGGGGKQYDNVKKIVERHGDLAEGMSLAEKNKLNLLQRLVRDLCDRMLNMPHHVRESATHKCVLLVKRQAEHDNATRGCGNPNCRLQLCRRNNPTLLAAALLWVAFCSSGIDIDSEDILAALVAAQRPTKKNVLIKKRMVVEELLRHTGLYKCHVDAVDMPALSESSPGRPPADADGEDDEDGDDDEDERAGTSAEARKKAEETQAAEQAKMQEESGRALGVSGALLEKLHVQLKLPYFVVQRAKAILANWVKYGAPAAKPATVAALAIFRSYEQIQPRLATRATLVKICSVARIAPRTVEEHNGPDSVFLCPVRFVQASRSHLLWSGTASASEIDSAVALLKRWLADSSNFRIQDMLFEHTHAVMAASALVATCPSLDSNRACIELCGLDRQSAKAAVNGIVAASEEW